MASPGGARMTLPPQGGWPPPQQPSPPPNQGQPYGQRFVPSGYNTQQPPPGWQQGAWAPHPGPPPQKGNSVKWLLIGIAVLLVIGISVAATLIFTRGGDGGGTTTPTSGAPSDVASANDTGPVAIITDEPTCGAFVGINNSLADIQANGWGAERNTLGPGSVWTTDQRNRVDAVATATRAAADQMVALAKRTPHRLVRELYEGFIAYGRAYADSVANYTPEDNELASANVNASSALVGICNTITFGSAGRSLGVNPATPPKNGAAQTDPANAQRFMTAPDQACASWEQISDKFDATTSEWQQRDTSIPAAQWTPPERTIEEAARPYIEIFANDMAEVGRESANAVFEDFAAAAALYLRASVSAGDNYVAADSWLSYVAFRFNLVVIGACNAASK